MAVEHERDTAGVERGVREVATARARHCDVGVCRRACRGARQVPGRLQRQASRPDQHRGAGIENRRRRLRQSEQPQRLELDLPVEAHDPDLREGHASATEEFQTIVASTSLDEGMAVG